MVRDAHHHAHGHTVDINSTRLLSFGKRFSFFFFLNVNRNCIKTFQLIQSGRINYTPETLNDLDVVRADMRLRKLVLAAEYRRVAHNPRKCFLPFLVRLYKHKGIA